MKIRYTPEAKKDIVREQQYIRENFFDDDAAERLGRSIVENVSLLKEQPNMGRLLSERLGQKTEIWYLPVKKRHIVFYRISGEEIQIIRILDTRTDYMKEMFDS
ncbi:MAG: type II toxin-antitoxin system RelE/ParE family toxin [Lachnospiraceae bacterium]|nr:type II toxin-antitoxin system RelE/ParE family toxin [Lachnospiraceae bacterium]